MIEENDYDYFSNQSGLKRQNLQRFEKVSRRYRHQSPSFFYRPIDTSRFIDEQNSKLKKRQSQIRDLVEANDRINKLIQKEKAVGRAAFSIIAEPVNQRINSQNSKDQKTLQNLGVRIKTPKQRQTEINLQMMDNDAESE